MEMSLGDRLRFIEKLLREAMTFSGGECNGLTLQVDIENSCAKIWFGTRGDKARRWGALGLQQESCMIVRFQGCWA